MDNSGKNDPISLTISNSTITNCDYAFIASTGNNANNKFKLILNGGNNFDVKENIGRFAIDKYDKKLEANVVINSGSYKANEGKGILFVFADKHDEWKDLFTANITINGGSLSETIVEASVNDKKIDLPNLITINDRR